MAAMHGSQMFSVAVIISAILVVAAVVMTVVRWREEGRRRAAQHARTRTRTSRTALAQRPAPTLEYERQASR